MSKKKSVEFRKDIVSGEWILVSSLRQARPVFFKKIEEAKKENVSIRNCPFENPQKSGNKKPVLEYFDNNGEWSIQIIPNKYPVLYREKTCPIIGKYGIQEKIAGAGFHEIIITRDHNKDLKKLRVDEINVLFKAYKERYRILAKEKCVEYILIFHNQGELAGASVEHPHSQLVALPIIPPDVSRSINGGFNFFKKNKKCVHCVLIDWEIKQKKRIISKNKYFIAFAPYASRVPYEIRIFPLKHSSDFEEITYEERDFLAEIFKECLLLLSRTLNNPDYNFFIHTSSSKVKNVPYYHWHIEILPRMYKWAGLELGTGIEVVAVPPEQAAEHLRKEKK